MTLTFMKKEEPVFITDTGQLAQLLHNPASTRPLMLGGQLVICSLEPMVPPPGFVAQAPRAGGKSKLRNGNGAAKKLHMVVDRQTLEELLRLRKKASFSVDALLRYGSTLKGAAEYCVLAAFAGTDAMQVLALTFKKQSLTGYVEYQLSSPQTYSSDLQVLLTRLAVAQPAAVFHWCGPVAAPTPHSFTQPAHSIWAATPAHTLSLTGRPPLLARHAPALGVLALTLIGYTGALAVPYYAYLDARQALRVESQTLQGLAAFDADRLPLLRSRQAFFEMHKSADLRFSQFVDVLAAFAQQPGLSVKDATLFAPADPTQAAKPGQLAEFEVVVEVPRRPELSVLDQGRPLLEALSLRMGGGLRLATGGGAYREAELSGGPALRQYRIQGDFKRGI